MLIDGMPACAKCGIRPRRPVPPTAKATRRAGRRFYSYCGICHAEYMSARRSGTTEMAVSPEERELILELRRVQPAGRHHARLQESA